MVVRGRAVGRGSRLGIFREPVVADAAKECHPAPAERVLERRAVARDGRAEAARRLAVPEVGLDDKRVPEAPRQFFLRVDRARVEVVAAADTVGLGKARSHVLLAARPLASLVEIGKVPVVHVRLASPLLPVGEHERAAELEKPIICDLPVDIGVKVHRVVFRAVALAARRFVPAIAAAWPSAPDGDADVARLVGLLEHRLEPDRHVLDRAPRERRRNRVGLPRIGALLRALAKIGRREDVKRANCADSELVVAVDLICVNHTALAPCVAPDGGVLLEVDPVAAEVRALKVHVDGTARTRVVLLRSRAAGKRADRALHDFDALHKERIHEKPSAEPDRHDAVESWFCAAHATYLESSRLADEKRLAAGLYAWHVAEKVVEVGRIVLSDKVLGQRVDDCRRLLGRKAGKGRALHRLGSIL